MDIYSSIIVNREFFRLFYMTLIGFICFIIAIKTHKLFRISLHQGIRYFRNAFFFYGLGFILKYILGIASFNGTYSTLTRGIFEFFLLMGGFFLLYSLIWKKFENSIENAHSSLFNLRAIIFYLLALIIVLLDFLWRGYSFMFGVQIIIFVYASIISYNNYMQRGSKHKFLKLYFCVMLLNLFAWTLNFIVATFYNWNKMWVVNIHALNILIFLLFLFGVIKVTKKSGEK